MYIETLDYDKEWELK